MPNYLARTLACGTGSLSPSVGGPIPVYDGLVSGSVCQFRGAIGP